MTCPNCKGKGFVESEESGARCTECFGTGTIPPIPEQIQARLEYLRAEIEAERISYGEIAELQSLAAHIDPGDVLLLQWAGVEESSP